MNITPNYQLCQQIAKAILAMDIVPISGQAKALLLRNTKMLRDATNDPAIMRIAADITEAVARGQQILQLPPAAK